ncbi:MAG: hypothetical protein U0792_09075 [Gemmataceae bacterium]
MLGDKLVVSGRVRDFVQGGQILQIIRSNPVEGAECNRRPCWHGWRTDRTHSDHPGGRLPGSNPGAPQQQPMTQEAFQSAGGPNVINLLEVAGEQQVMLRVIVAEVNRAAARSIGMNFSGQTARA